ncbi:histidine phosphatase family protein [Saccharopolyspora shandongensis]|uniref:Broad specificity phosphatase PhoE n=1 Tax=Saccharopolyspora shandongensis TaxID=418495 RepID=A0A1H3JCN4_9PSEU|nr:histidine phosphatase family protein [Saccharopolyspora shandongensis]SDY37733.1 Broad specificity phosphatase PhoE [Saccharopolyspora shandongensis]
MTGEKTVVHFLRHGEVHNPEGVLYGRLPGYRLSDRGEQQAKVVAEFLAGRDVAHVVASPLQRAQQTAMPIGGMFQLGVATDDRLIEADNRFEGLKVSVGDGALRSPKHWPKLWNPLRPSWGEPYLEIAHRMLGAAHRARSAAAGHEAVCVSHQLPIWTLRRFLEGKPMWHDPRRRQCSLASLTSLVFRGEELVRIAYVEPAGETDPKVTGA